MENALNAWLCPPDAEESYSAAATQRCPGTCLWIFEDATYEQWIKEGGLLWLNGIGEELAYPPIDIMALIHGPS